MWARCRYRKMSMSGRDRCLSVGRWSMGRVSAGKGVGSNRVFVWAWIREVGVRLGGAGSSQRRETTVLFFFFFFCFFFSLLFCSFFLRRENRLCLSGRDRRRVSWCGWCCYCSTGDEETMSSSLVDVRMRAGSQVSEQ
ncbi:hypothetical protein LZ32DRAFT_119574 [Colletotrichum eremochloae]|nr:hypothetical protein LZ32DRAFT_119574 [Colletotrichum eremochloae]